MADLTNKPRATPQVKFSGRGGTGRFRSLVLTHLRQKALFPWEKGTDRQVVNQRKVGNRKSRCFPDHVGMS
jgi:hypothetical protein